jgi:hypothetical protein
MMLRNIKNKIIKMLPFNSGLNYKTLYESEKRLRSELEENHRAFCGQMDAVMKESKERFSVYKIKDHNKEF